MTRVLVIIYEAAEITLLERWADEGRLPTFSRLRREAAGFRLANHTKLMADGTLPEITAGLSIARTGEFNVLARLHAGEAVARSLTSEEERAFPCYWTVASRAGRRVIVIDHSWGAPGPGFTGFFVKGFGLHHVNVKGSDPPSALDELIDRYGPYPVGQCDADYARTLADHDRLRQDLLAGLRRKERLLLDRLPQRDWDLFSATISEAHCAGHQFWYLHDEGHRDHPAHAPAHLQDALRTMYVAADATLGRMIDAAGDDVVTAIVVPRGMARLAGGMEILPEFLHRLGLGSGRWLWMKLGFAAPRSLKLFIRKIVPQHVLNGLQIGLNSRMQSFDGARAKVIAVDNPGVGALRLNLAGREPEGCIQPGEEAERLLAMLRAELAALRDVRTGEPAIERIATAAEVFGPGYHPDLPDLFVRFRTDLGVIDACTSPRVGVLRRPDPPTRTGDHTDHARMWLIGPGIEPCAEPKDANVLDVAPTILDLLDVPIPDEMEGASCISMARQPVEEVR